MKKYTVGVSLLAIIIICLWYFSGYYVYTHFPESKTGSIGDLFSPINSLFAGLAFCGIIITIYLQQKELSLQRQELINTREIFQKQKFENTFFNLASLHQDLVNNLHHEFSLISKRDGVETERNHYEFNGRDYFSFIENDIRELYAYVKRSIAKGSLHEKDKNNTRIDRMTFDYSINPNFFYDVGDWEYRNIDLRDDSQLTTFLCKKVFTKIEYKTSHYLRHLLSVLEFINTTEEEEIQMGKSDEEKKEIKKRFKNYAIFFQSQHSNSELLFLFYKTLEMQEAKALLAKYNFFSSLPQEFLLSRDHYKLHN